MQTTLLSTGPKCRLGLATHSSHSSCKPIHFHTNLRRCNTQLAAVPARSWNEFNISSLAATANAAAAPVLASLMLLSTVAPSVASVAVLEGPPRIVDGDTLYIGSEKVRLYAVDAPEKSQSCNDSKGQPYMCGQVSLQALKAHVGNNSVRCEVKTKDQYGRNVAACSILSLRGAEDMNGWLVSNGYAVAYKQYGKDYIQLEEQARATHRGIWQGEFTEPALWRKQQKAANLTNMVSAPALTAGAPSAGNTQAAVAATGQAAAVAAAGLPQQVAPSVKCNGPVIKGNINSKGEKIYHTVNSGSYNRVQIDEKDGERYFCTEQEAQAAGWRAAKK